MRILPPGDIHSLPLSEAANTSVDGFLPLLAAMAFSAANFKPMRACAMR